MNCPRRLGQMIRACATLLLAVGFSGCAVHSFQRVTPPIAAQQRCPTSDPAFAEGCRCAADPEYHSTVWFPLTPECFGDIDPAEEPLIPPPDISREIDPRPRSTPPETDLAKHPEARGRENAVPETSDQQDVILAIPEPSWQDLSSPAEGQPEEAGTSVASETGG